MNVTPLLLSDPLLISMAFPAQPGVAVNLLFLSALECELPHAISPPLFYSHVGC